MCIACKPDPVAIHKDLGLIWTVQVFISELLEFFDSPVLQSVDNICRVATNRDERHQSQILD